MFSVKSRNMELKKNPSLILDSTNSIFNKHATKFLTVSYRKVAIASKRFKDVQFAKSQ
jgi:hypothetical protein